VSNLSAVSIQAILSVILFFIIRIEARLQAEYCIHFTVGFDGVHAFWYNSAESEPIWMKFGALWVQCWRLAHTLAHANSGRNSLSSDCGRSRRNLVSSCQVNNARFYRFPVGQISRNLNKTRRSVSQWIPSEQNFENFPVRIVFCKNWAFFPNLATSGRHNCAMINDQWSLYGIYVKKTYQFKTLC